MNLLDNQGVPLDQQVLSWKEMVAEPISKLDDDAFTRLRVILLYALEADALRLQHVGALLHPGLREPLARIRRIEQHQATAVHWLLSADHSALETTIACEQLAIELSAAVAQREPDPYLAQVCRFALLEHCDHLYRYAALLDRLEGKDANNILQGHTDIVPGRSTAEAHRAPQDDLRRPLGREARLLSRLDAILLEALEAQCRDYYLHLGPTFADPLARLLYAEIASVEEQHATQYGSLFAPPQSFLEVWLLHEAAEVHAYDSCARFETNPRLRALWERFCDYELGQLRHVGELLRRIEGREPAELLRQGLPAPLALGRQRDFVREVLAAEVDLCAHGPDFVERRQESVASLAYRGRVNAQGSPSTHVAAAYRWSSGTELNRPLDRAG